MRRIRVLRETVSGICSSLGAQQQHEDEAEPSQKRKKLDDGTRKSLGELRMQYESIEKLGTMLTSKDWPPVVAKNLQHLIAAAPTDEDTDFLKYTVLDTLSWTEKLKEYSDLSFKLYTGNIRRNTSALSRNRGVQPLNLPSRQDYYNTLSINMRNFVRLLKVEIFECSRMTATILVQLLLPVTAPPPPGTQPLIVLKAALLLRNTVCEWINVIGPDEDFRNAQNEMVELIHSCFLRGNTTFNFVRIIRHLIFFPSWKMPHKIDVTKASDYEIFQKISNFMQSYLLSYPPHIFVYDLNMLTKYRNLFSEPCKGCKKILKAYLPPHVSDMQSGMFHESCRGK